MRPSEADPKARLVNLLLERKGASGEALAFALGVTRAAVWKHVQKLKADGFEIAARRGKGYRLLRLTDRLVAYEIERRVRTKRIGRRIICLPQTTSTNDEVRRLAADGEPEGVCVFAERQTAGRGRRGRTWTSTPGEHVTGSVLLRPPVEPANVQLLSLLAALATARAIESTTGLDARTKWPNDVVLDGRKVGGILVEMQAEPDRVAAATVGIGVNVNGTAAELGPDLASPATTIEECLGRATDRLPVLCALIEQLDALYDDHISHGPNRLLALWRDSDLVLGKSIEVRTPRGNIVGKALDVGPDGCLILAQRDGTTVSVVAGDVSVRPRDVV